MILTATNGERPIAVTAVRDMSLDPRSPRRRLYVSDLDGTLLNSRACLSDFARRSLTGLLASGVRFTVATARSAPAVRSILGDLVTTTPIIEQNGACVTDLSSGEHLAVFDIPSPIADEALTLFRRFESEPIVACIVDGADRLFYERPGNRGTEWYIEEKVAASDPRLACVEDVAAVRNAQVLSITTLVDEARARSLADALNQVSGGQLQIRLGANGYAPAFWELSVLDVSATKARGIELLRGAIGMEDAELVVFGDAENDMDMFLAADWAIAVGNATPELRALAKQVVGSNEADGVIHWLLAEHGRVGHK